MKVQISAKNRNLGLGWSNVPSGKGIEITPPNGPSVVGGLRSIERELTHAYNLNRGNFWIKQLFVGGEPVVAFEIPVYLGPDDVDMGLTQVLPPNVGEIVMLLREGETVTVEVDK